MRLLIIGLLVRTNSLCHKRYPDVLFLDHVETTWHSLGTAAMKPREEGGVVDKRLNVFGTQNLKVVDLSICPVRRHEPNSVRTGLMVRIGQSRDEYLFVCFTRRREGC